MKHEEFQRAANYWKVKDADSIRMDKEPLMKAMEEYILSNNTCALATGSGTFVRCTPIEYTYYEGAFWMLSEGGMKFAALENNSNVCLAIYDKYQGFGKLHGMQVSGIAEIVEPFSQNYITIAQVKKIPVEALKKLDNPMSLIKVIPEHIDFLSSDFKEKGFSNRQALDL